MSFQCSAWFERDRANLTLTTDDGREVFCLWDDEVTEAIEDGYLPTPRLPRPSDSDWLPCAIEYARYYNLI